MADDKSGLTDEVATELNPEVAEAGLAGEVLCVPGRPVDGAAKARWVEYCVALGADRGQVTGESQHFDADAEVTRTRQVLVTPYSEMDPDYFDDVATVIEASAGRGESADDFAARMRGLYEDARRCADQDPEFREETVTERGGYVKSKALTREELIELADRLGG